MELPFWFTFAIAANITFWSLCVVVVSLGTLIVLFKIAGAVKRLERTVEDLKKEAMPIIYRGKDLADDFRSLGKDARKQLKKSEHMVEDTLRNVAETTTRVREAITGLSMILSASGRLLSIFGGGKSGKGKEKE